MKNLGISRIYVIGCIGVLFASYGVGRGIRAVRFQRAANAGTEQQVVAKPESPGTEPEIERTETMPMAMPGPAMGGREGRGFRGQRGISEEERAQMKDRFENMSEAEKEDFRAQMRERFGGRQRGGGGGSPMMQNLSEEERDQFREEMEDLRARWEEMSEEEREQARAQMEEKYGFAPRVGMGGGPGGGRGSGGGEFGRRRPGGGFGGGRRGDN